VSVPGDQVARRFGCNEGRKECNPDWY
jgi:hypothetical protein